MFVPIVATVAIGTLGCVVLLTLRTRARIAARLLPKTESVLEALPDHFAITENGRTRSYAWEAVRVIETPNHVFLCPSPREAIIVPRRAFDTEADMYVFAQWAEELGKREPTSQEPWKANQN